MTYVITDACIDLKDQSCVQECPVDCIKSDDNSKQYFIDPDICIDCGACQPVCPVNAIYPGDEVPPDQEPDPDQRGVLQEGLRPGGFRLIA